MLTRLVISNYALIDELSVSFEEGLTIMTGETGAGKSIILGAFGLILGSRADSSFIRNPDKKCIVEGSFLIKGYGLEYFFTENDLDYDHSAILRREISPNGKSRAFINDTPVNLQTLRELTLKLVDIHSQHQNLDLSSQQFQLRIIDIVSRAETLFNSYHDHFNNYKLLKSSLKELEEEATRSKADLDYISFQFNQLQEARLQENEQSQWEEEREKLLHAEEIKNTLLQVSEILDGDHFPVLGQLKELSSRLEKIRSYFRQAGVFSERMTSTFHELKDIAGETGHLAENIEYNPQRLLTITERLDLIYSLQQKHHVESVEKLIELRETLARRIAHITDYDDEISLQKSALQECEMKLKEAARNLTSQRKNAFPVIQHKVMDVLGQLGIPHAFFKIDHKTKETYSDNGTDQVQFLFSANKNGTPDEISRIASGGEISRLMLALKTLVTGSTLLPTIIFDEIDAGISGEIAMKMGVILKKLAEGMQVIHITHLPQIAGMGDHHFKVLKTENATGTFTLVKKLNPEERIEELAQMVGGENPSETARMTARELLKHRNYK